VHFVVYKKAQMIFNYQYLLSGCRGYFFISICPHRV